MRKLTIETIDIKHLDNVNDICLLSHRVMDFAWITLDAKQKSEESGWQVIHSICIDGQNIEGLKYVFRRGVYINGGI